MVEYIKKDGDEVNFTFRGRVYPYKVNVDHLYLDHIRNDALFIDMGFDQVGKVAFCEKAYGYKIIGGNFGSSWPECRTGDWDALNRVIGAIIQEIDRREGKIISDKEIINMSTFEKIKTFMKGEPEKTFVKIGMTDVNGDLTGDGKTAFIHWLLQKHKDEFAKDIATPLLAEIKADK